MLPLESSSLQEACLARSFLYILGPLRAESLVAGGKRAFTPALPVRLDVLRGEVVADASFPQLVTNLQWTLPARRPLDYEALRETSIGQQILGLQRIQRVADEIFGESAHRELAPELGARVLAARQKCGRLVADRFPRFVQASASSVASASSTSSAAAGVRDRSLSRSARSMAAALSGCCFRYSRTLSRPWPMRSPL